jgi:hypothetical protein
MICPVLYGIRGGFQMKRTEWLQETRKMRFEEAYEGYRDGGLTQSEAGLLLGVCDRTFRRYMNRYDEGGLDALVDKHLSCAGIAPTGAGR